MARKFAKARLRKGLTKRGRVKKAAKKAKLTTEKTKVQAGEKIRSLSDQVAGTKDHGVQEMSAPRITNDTVAEHREQVLSEARRYIYPLQSRRRIIVTSISIIVGLIAMTIILTGLMLYKFQSTGSFAYNVSRLVPFPVARVDGHFIAYEQYLFEVRSSIFYLTNYAQEGIEIDSEEGQALAQETKRRILDKIQVDALGMQIARANDIKVTDEEIAKQINLFEIRGGIDQSEGTLESVLAKYYDWDLKDFERVVEQQLMLQKLLPILDAEAKDKLSLVLSKLEDGMLFKAAVANYSEDELTNQRAGSLGSISRDNTTFSEDTLEVMFGLDVGEYSEPITAPSGYFIFYVSEKPDDDTVEAAQLFIRFFDLETYLAEKLESVAHRAYITIE